jgi:hypothetical protein
MNNISTTVFDNKNTIFLHYNDYHKLLFTSKQRLRLSPTLLTEFGDGKGQMGLGGLQETGPKRAYLQFWTPVNRSWSTVFIRLCAERSIADPVSRFLLLLNAACLCAPPTARPRSALAVARPCAPPVAGPGCAPPAARSRCAPPPLARGALRSLSSACAIPVALHSPVPSR